MNTASLLIWSLRLSFVLMGCVAVAPVSRDTTQALEAIRKQHDLPALTVVVVKDGKIRDRAVVGVRKVGDPTRVNVGDQFRIGSCTKSMTATLAAMLVEEGKLK